MYTRLEMSIALIPRLPCQIIDKIHELIPRDIHIRIIHDNHPLMEANEYFYVVRQGTTIYELKEMLLDDEFRKFGWDSRELILFRRIFPNDILDDDNMELDENEVLKLQLSQILWSDCSENDSEDDYRNEEDEEE